MVPSQRCNFEALKSAIAQKQLSVTNLELLKTQFKDDIKSPRRFACIKSLADLIDCLERRDCISEYDIAALQYIAGCLYDDQILLLLQTYVPQPIPESLTNIYSLQRTLERNGYGMRNMKLASDQNVSYKYTLEKCEAIKKHISLGIGKSWRFFGLGLRLRIGDLDSIEQKYPTDLHSRVYEVFRIFEEDARLDLNNHFEKICEALANCKRKDLVRDIKAIMRSG